MKAEKNGQRMEAVLPDYGGVTCSVEIITPDKAREWLKDVKTNRAIRPGTVRRYATDMENGKWIFNGESLVVSDKGRLINGFHRCAAVARTDIPVPAVVVRGVTEEAYKTFDTGSTRTPTDTLGALGVKRPSRAANAIAKLIALDRGKWATTGKGNCNIVKDGHYGNRNAIVAQLYLDNREFFDELTLWGYNLTASKSALLSNLGLTRSDIIATAAHLMRTLGNPDQRVRDFFHLLLGDTANASCPPSHFVDQLRDKLMAYRMDYNRNGRRTTPKIIQSTIAKAWLLFSRQLTPSDHGINLTEDEKEYGLTFGGGRPVQAKTA